MPMVYLPHFLHGPSSDGRVKPTVSAQGGNTTVITSSNAIATSNGTSFLRPLFLV